MNKNSEIVVLMTTYKKDRLDFLKQAIESLYNQTFMKFDIYFGVDGEINKNTREYLEGIRTKYSNFYIYYFKKNRGLSPTLNSLIKTSVNKYKYFVRMDSDDVSEPKRIEYQYNFLKNNIEIDIVGSNAKEINNDNIEFKSTIYPQYHKDIFKRISTRNPMVHSAVMIRKTYFDKAGLYPETYHKSRKTALPVEDSLMWLQGLMKNCKFHNLQESLVKIRYDIDLFKRRGGFFNAYQEFKVNYEIITTLNSKKINHIYNIIIFIIRIQPIYIRMLLWKILR